MAKAKPRTVEEPSEGLPEQEPGALEVVVQTTPARVLVACSLGRPNDVVHLDAGTLSAAQAAGLIDPHPDAVAAAAALR